MIALHRRTRTLERGIEWLPRHDAHYILAGMLVSARDAPPICVLQSTLKSIELHIRADGPWQYGLLTGQLCFCRRSERAYTLIDGSVECPTPDDEGDDYSTMALELGERMTQLEREGVIAMGFYRSGAVVLPRATRGNIGLLRTLFEHPWQMMLLRDSPAHGGTGAFIRVESMDGQPYAAPFRELLPKPGWRHRKDTPSSVVMWQNYQPTEEIRQLSLPPLRITTNAHVAREIQVRTESHTDVSHSVEGTGKDWSGLRRSYLLPARKPEADHRSNDGDVTPGGYPALFRPADPKVDAAVDSSTAAPSSGDTMQSGGAASDPLPPPKASYTPPLIRSASGSAAHAVRDEPTGGSGSSAGNVAAAPMVRNFGERSPDSSDLDEEEAGGARLPSETDVEAGFETANDTKAGEIAPSSKETSVANTSEERDSAERLIDEVAVEKPGQMEPERAIPEAAIPEAAIPEAAIPQAAIPEAAIPEAVVSQTDVIVPAGVQAPIAEASIAEPSSEESRDSQRELTSPADTRPANVDVAGSAVAEEDAVTEAFDGEPAARQGTSDEETVRPDDPSSEAAVVSEPERAANLFEPVLLPPDESEDESSPIGRYGVVAAAAVVLIAAAMAVVM